MNEKNILKIVFKYNILSIIILLFHLVNCRNHSFERVTPFLKQGICVDNCTYIEVKNGDCKVDNEKIKIQWINSINNISNRIYTYINMLTTKEGNLLVIISQFPDIKERLFYSLTNEGRGYFTDNNNKETPILIKLIDTPKIIERFESEIIPIKFNDKEYLLSVSKYTGFLEVYNLDSYNIIYDFINKTFSEFHYFTHQIGAHIKLSSSENNYLIGIMSDFYNNYGQFI